MNSMSEYCDFEDLARVGVLRFAFGMIGSVHKDHARASLYNQGIVTLAIPAAFPADDLSRRTNCIHS